VVVNQNGSLVFTERLSKTEDARTVPVPTPVMDVLGEHLKGYHSGAGREDFLFLTHRGTHRSGAAFPGTSSSPRYPGLGCPGDGSPG